MPRSLPVNCLPSPGTGARDDKYWERRRCVKPVIVSGSNNIETLVRKNNLAAKKSRDTRRMRENQLRLRVLFLENANKVHDYHFMWVIIIIIKVLREQMERKDCESGKLRSDLYLFPFLVCDI